MATEEMKSETKKTEEKQSPEVKDLLPPPLPLPYKTCSFKVSIHCEGCKRKVKKILTTIEGVYKVDIDVKQQKVTVMGIVSPEILLKKLHKSGKNADLIPEITEPVENNKPGEPKEKNQKKKKKQKEEKPEITDKATSSVSDKPESEKPDAAVDCNSSDGGETSAPVVKEEKKVVVKEKDSVPADALVDSPAPAESPSPAAEKKAEETGSGNVGKKKKKKGQSGGNSNPTGGPVRTRSLPPPASITPAAEDPDRLLNHHQMPTNNNPPRHDMYAYPPNYYAPQIMYGVSYNVAQPPVSVDGASYYSPAPPNSYAYMHPGYPPYDQNPYQPRPSDSFELFSDENPNGCSVM